jgi:hypothetical protein
MQRIKLTIQNAQPCPLHTSIYVPTSKARNRTMVRDQLAEFKLFARRLIDILNGVSLDYNQS